MDANARADDSLVLRYDSTRLSRVMFVVAAAVLAGAGYHLLSDRGDGAWLIGFLGGSVTCGLLALVVLERAHVVVDPATRRVAWTRRWALRTHRGSLSFDDIGAVYAERPLGDSGIPSRRIVIATRSGGTIPLTAGYRPDADQVILKAAEQIRAILGQTVAAADTVRAMVAGGRLMDAVVFLRETEGLSLIDARRRVDAIRGKS